MRFDDLSLAEPLLRAVATAGYETATPIQAEAIPHILNGRDVIGTAQTGTGKTAAFALPMLHQLHETSPQKRRKWRRPIRSLIICPTRELAQQIHESFRTYGQHTNLRYTSIFGGVNQNPQTRILRDGVDTLIATPGRLLDLINQGYVDLSHVEIFVLDEADRMMDMGFLPDIYRVIEKLPAKRQTLFFSATMPKQIRQMADKILTNAVPIQVARVSSPAETVEHWVYHVEKPEKIHLLTKLLSNTPYSRVLIFTRTKHGADKVARQLTTAKMNATALHGNKTQAARNRALADFKSAKIPVLVATDIAARGLDVTDISHVINYDLTNEPETYVHRIGRTGRAGETGIALSFCARDERGHLNAIERLLESPLKPGNDVPGYDRPQRSTPASTRSWGGPKREGTSGRRSSTSPSRRRPGSGNGSAGRNGNGSTTGSRNATGRHDAAERSNGESRPSSTTVRNRYRNNDNQPNNDNRNNSDSRDGERRTCFKPADRKPGEGKKSDSKPRYRKMTDRQLSEHKARKADTRKTGDGDRSENKSSDAKKPSNFKRKTAKPGSPKKTGEGSGKTNRNGAGQTSGKRKSFVKKGGPKKPHRGQRTAVAAGA